MNSSWNKYFFTPSYSSIEKHYQPIQQSIYFGGLCCLISLGLFIQFNYQKVQSQKLNIPFSTKHSLTQKINYLEKLNSINESKLIILNHQLTRLLEEKNQQFLDNFQSLIATKELKGEGVIVKLNDSNKPLTFDENPNLMVVHNLDLLSIVNELWGHGARAISVNNQRITASSEFNCIGPIILINKSRVLPPFEIKAIGNPERLANTVSEGYVKKYKLEQYGISFSVDTQKDITIPASMTLAMNSKKGNL